MRIYQDDTNGPWVAEKGGIVVTGDTRDDAVNLLNEAKNMNQFEKAIQDEIKCDICGEIMLPMYGGGWDYDRVVCANRDCGAEIIYSTSTEIPEGV